MATPHERTGNSKTQAGRLTSGFFYSNSEMIFSTVYPSASAR